MEKTGLYWNLRGITPFVRKNRHKHRSPASDEKLDENRNYFCNLLSTPVYCIYPGCAQGKLVKVLTLPFYFNSFLGNGGWKFLLSLNRSESVFEHYTGINKLYVSINKLCQELMESKEMMKT